jgi:hypothetical protein
VQMFNRRLGLAVPLHLPNYLHDHHHYAYI